MERGWRLAGSVTGPLSTATLGASPSGHAPDVPYSPLYDDVYHAAAGAWPQARHVFLGGNGLPARWQGQPRFTVLETGFGLGNNFLATWAAWLDDPARCDQLVFISVEKHPLTQADLRQVHAISGLPADDPDAGRRAELGARLADAWPVLTPGWHQRRFADPSRPGQAVILMLGLGDVAELLPGLMAAVDAFYLDGFAPAKNPEMWQPDRLARLNRLAAPGATAATWSSARPVRDGLAQAGFVVARAPGFAGKRDMVRAAFRPRHVSEPAPGGLWPAPHADARRAVIVGAGLAGCAAAWALCRQGWAVTLLDRHVAPASEASGNPGGLFHSVLHNEDGIHARAHRAAALATWTVVQQAVRDGVAGSGQGLLRLDARQNAADAGALLTRLGLPPDHVQWLDQGEAVARTGIPVPSGGWFFHQAGWVHPAGLAAWFLDQARSASCDGAALQWRGEAEAASLRRTEAGEWMICDMAGQPLAQAPTVVLACAHTLPGLIVGLPEAHACAAPPVLPVRGQVSWGSQLPGQRQPAVPVAGSGYALGLDAHTLLFGATTQHHDADPAVREADHRHNLQQAVRLGAVSSDGAGDPLAHDLLPHGLHGRVGWRATTPDRLPLVGALPWSDNRLSRLASRARRDQVRLIPRERNARGGLYVLSGLGSRGITWSTLAGELLAHWVTGSACPVEASLRDALDPARFLARQHRQQG